MNKPIHADGWMDTQTIRWTEARSYTDGRARMDGRQDIFFFDRTSRKSALYIRPSVGPSIGLRSLCCFDRFGLLGVAYVVYTALFYVIECKGYTTVSHTIVLQNNDYDVGRLNLARI